MKILATVVTYNRKELLKECIESLLTQSYKDFDILILDNASTDGTEAYINDYIISGKIEYYNTGSNLGGAGGFNLAMRKAAEREYDFVWVMDDDCMSREHALDNFLIADKKLSGNYGFLSSKVLWKDGSICTMNVQRQTLTKNVSDFESSIVEIKMASFVSLFVPVKIIKELGLPIKDFFIWTDDWEFTRRISRKYPCYLINKSIVVHKSASNIGANISTDTEDRLDRYNYLYRNDAYLYRHEGIRGFLYEVPRLCAHVVRVLKSDCSNKSKRISIIFKATINGLKFNPEIEYVE